MVLKVAQINLQHSKAASANLLSLLAEERFHIVLIQEPWVNSNKICGLKSDTYYTINHSEEGKAVRSCVLSHKDLKCFLLPHLSSGDITTIQLEHSEGRLILTSSYMAHNEPSPPELTTKILSHCTDNRLPLIIGCDANAHHIQWGSKKINERGESLFEYIITNNLNICNIGNVPTFVTRNRTEVLDLTLSSCNVKDWKVSNIHSYSDHRLITFTYDSKTPSPTPFRNMRKTDWVKFKALT